MNDQQRRHLRLLSVACLLLASVLSCTKITESKPQPIAFSSLPKSQTISSQEVMSWGRDFFYQNKDLPQLSLERSEYTVFGGKYYVRVPALHSNGSFYLTKAGKQIHAVFISFDSTKESGNPHGGYIRFVDFMSKKVQIAHYSNHRPDLVYTYKSSADFFEKVKFGSQFLKSNAECADAIGCWVDNSNNWWHRLWHWAQDFVSTIVDWVVNMFRATDDDDPGNNELPTDYDQWDHDYFDPVYFNDPAPNPIGGLTWAAEFTGMPDGTTHPASIDDQDISYLGDPDDFPSASDPDATVTLPPNIEVLPVDVSFANDPSHFVPGGCHPIAVTPPRSDSRTIPEDLTYGYAAFPSWINISDSYSNNDLVDLMHGGMRLFTFFNSDLHTVGDDMIRHFEYGNGENYTNSILDANVAISSNFKAFVGYFSDNLNSQLRDHAGNLSAIPTMLLRKRPIFGGLYDRFHGLQILINDTEQTKIEICNYEVSADGHWRAIIKVSIEDHFGLDLNDAQKYQGYDYMFSAWWALQHCRGFKPFKTFIHVTTEIHGKF